MPKKASIKYHSLRSNLVHLPLSLYASLVQQQAVSSDVCLRAQLISFQRPQGLILHLSPFVASSSKVTPKTAYLGWSGLAAASSLAGIGAGVEGETVEVDPEVAMGLGWPEGTIVRDLPVCLS
jgi:peroxin-1